MPEYFDISFIVEKKPEALTNVKHCLENFGLFEGENPGRNSVLEMEDILVSYYEGEVEDFDEVTIGIPNQVFHATTFEKDLEKFSVIVNKCFESTDALKFALCSFEINSYLMRDTSKLVQMDGLFLLKFPIVYKKSRKLLTPELLTNLKAQNLW